MKTEPNEVHNRPKLVTVFGGSGFVGRAVVAALTKRGYRVRVAVRKPEIAYYMAPLGNVGQIQMVQANVRHRGSVEHVIKGSDHVVNLVGILSESGRQRFNTVQVLGAKNIAEAAKAAGIRMTHVSSLAADANSPSDYARTKAEGERPFFPSCRTASSCARRSFSVLRTASSTASPTWRAFRHSCLQSAAAKRSSSRSMSATWRKPWRAPSTAS